MSLISVICTESPANPDSSQTRASFESVLGGTYDKLELICIGAGAPGVFADLNDPRIRWVDCDPSGSLSLINQAIAQSRGELLTWIQPGDRWHPEKLSQQVSALEESSDPKTAIVYSRVSRNGTPLTAPPLPLPTPPVTLHDCLRLYYHWQTLSNPLIRREIWPEGTGLQGGDLLCGGWRIAVELTQGFPAIALEETLVELAPWTRPSLSQWQQLRQALEDTLAILLNPDDPQDFRAKAQHNLYKYLLARALSDSLSTDLAAALPPILKILYEDDPSLNHQGELIIETYRRLATGDRLGLSDRWLETLQVRPSPPITVVIPVYNGEATVQATINSILQQTFSDFELLVIDDGSTDNTALQVDEISDYRIRRLPYENAGLAASRNRGLEQARGTYISFLDADDLWHQEKLQAQYERLIHPPNTHPSLQSLYAVAYSWTDYIDELGQWLKPGSYLNLDGDALAHLLLADFLESGSNALIRTEAARQVGGFDESLPAAEDWDFFLKLAARYFFVCVPKAQIYYRVTPTSMSSNLQQQEFACLTILDRAFNKATQALDFLRSQSLANLYQYLSYRALQPPLQAENCRLALGFLKEIERWDSQASSYQTLLTELETFCRIYQDNTPALAARLCESGHLAPRVEDLFRYTKSRPYPSISVIIPAYNAETTIRETIDSVLAQTWRDFEIIVIDDGSTDDTLAIVKSIDDERLRVFSYPNAGQGESRNRGACHARGEFFAFLDSDDLWTPDKLESQYRAIVEWQPPPDAEAQYQDRRPAVAYSWVDWVDINGKFLQRGCDYTTQGYVYPELLLSDFIAGGSNAMIWRGAFYQVRGFNPDFPPAEDRDMWLRLSEKFHFVAVEKPQLRYRQVPTSQSANVIRMEHSQLRVLEAAFERASQVPPFSKTPKRLVAYRNQTYANSYKYLTFKALDGIPQPEQGRLALRLFWTVLRHEPQLWQERRFVLKLWLRILITAFFPPLWTEYVLQRFPTFPRLHRDLLGYTKMDA
ncbi:MAG: glycosyltransferase [Phormidium sp. GEM2.Bin31]|nr:MAG: glycosyltransferase [Phormidium sp. GEM2.Bin31]